MREAAEIMTSEEPFDSSSDEISMMVLKKNLIDKDT
jgi:hypothetical protein